MAKKTAAAKPALSATASALLDAQVAFFAERLDVAQLEDWLGGELDALLHDAKKLKLTDVVTATAVTEVALRYAGDLQLGPAVPELVSELAARIQAHPLQSKTPLGELMPDAQFNEWLEKILELKDARNGILHASLGNPVIHAIAGDLLYRGISGYLSEGSLTKNIPGASSMFKLGKSMLAKASPGLDQAIEDTLRRYIQQSLSATLRESEHSLRSLLSDTILRRASQEIWASIKGKTIAQFRSTVSSSDVEELFVIGYEHWKVLRQTPYYRAMIAEGVEGFFAKYGSSTLYGLLEELGLSRDMLLEDLHRFAPSVLKGLKKKKLLEPMLRRWLEPFFLSPAAAALLP